MKIFADLQIHSRYARATSKDITIANLEKWSKVKGLNLIGVGDFQHPEWRKEIDKELEEDKNGILWRKGSKREIGKDVGFLWQTEVSLMFSQGKRRAVHLLIFAPNKEIADKITSYLRSKGRLDYDGRPIFGMSCKQLVHDLKEIDDAIEMIPAHAFTPWFGVFGSDSGFDTLSECFEEEMKHIYAIESGMSADPSMAWRLPEIASGRINVVSFSDAHSFWPWRIGREATIFELDELSYENVVNDIRKGKFIGTIETYPEYGKYHWDGHRNCNFSCSPKETKKIDGVCPVCGKKLTIGVEYRVEEIAKEKEGFEPKNAKIFYKIVPLHELIAFALQSSMTSKKSWEVYNLLIDIFGSEFNILLEVKKEKLISVLSKFPLLIDLILLNREGKLKIKPGYDGVYGEVILEEKQSKLF